MPVPIFLVVVLLGSLSCWPSISVQAQECAQAEEYREHWTEVDAQSSLYFFQRHSSLVSRHSLLEGAASAGSSLEFTFQGNKTGEAKRPNKSETEKEKEKDEPAAPSQKSKRIEEVIHKVIKNLTDGNTNLRNVEVHIKNPPGNKEESETHVEIDTNENGTVVTAVTKSHGKADPNVTKGAQPNGVTLKNETKVEVTNKENIENGPILENDKTTDRVVENASDVTKKDQPFAHKRKKWTKKSKETVEPISKTAHKRINEETSITEEVLVVATPSQILTVYILLFTPLGVGWAVYHHLGCQQRHLLILLPITMGAASVGFDLVNQSLTLVTEVPGALTSFQALFMACSFLIWSFVIDNNTWDMSKDVTQKQWVFWLFVALAYSVFQLCNHLAFKKCSLSERTVFTNLGPIVAASMEIVVLPLALQKQLTFRTKLSLLIMLIGAILFSLQQPEFTAEGISSASLLVMTVVAARLSQRAYLGDPEQSNVPVGPLVAIDGAFVFISGSILASSEVGTLIENMPKWTADFSVSLMLILSCASFCVSHVCALLLMKNKSTPATLLVYQNISAILDVVFGLRWFGDTALANPYCTLGLSTSLLCGIWYSAEVIWADYSKEKGIPEDKPELADEPKAVSGG